MRSIVRVFPVLSGDVDRRPANGLPFSGVGDKGVEWERGDAKK